MKQKFLFIKMIWMVLRNKQSGWMFFRITEQQQVEFLNAKNDIDITFRYLGIDKRVVSKIVEGIESSNLVTENTSDGYHTFKELYEFRKAYNVALFNEWASQTKIETKFTKNSEGNIIEVPTEKSCKYDVHKSWKHNSGEYCFGGGWFIVVAITPHGQITNHYKAEDWDLFKIPEVDKAKYEFDGHTGQDVIKRLLNL